MEKLLILLTLLSLFPCFRNKDRIKNLDIRTRIDRVHVFGFDFSESRSAKGGIWNLRTGKPETPLNYMDIKASGYASTVRPPYDYEYYSSLER